VEVGGAASAEPLQRRSEKKPDSFREFEKQNYCSILYMRMWGVILSSVWSIEILRIAHFPLIYLNPKISAAADRALLRGDLADEQCGYAAKRGR
jgi:hypothetical protein